MFHCEIWCGSDELHTRRVSGLFPIGYEIEVDGHLGTEYIVEGGKIFLEHGTMDVRVEVYVREKPARLPEEFLHGPLTWRQPEQVRQYSVRQANPAGVPRTER